MSQVKPRVSSAVRFVHLTKKYGNIVGVENLSLNVEKGSIFGFLGPNGAGKTTTINMLVNLTKPTSGSVKIFGKDVTTDGLGTRSRIGYVAGDMALDGALTGGQQLEYFSHLRGISVPDSIQLLATRLQCDLTKKIKTLSRGNRQKVALIGALMHNPDLLILDEPTSGLDPLMQTEFNKLILEHKKNGGTTFISSHVLSEVQELCDRVAFIREGRLIADAPLSRIVKNAPKNVQCTVKVARSLEQLKGLAGMQALVIKNKRAEFTYSGDMTLLLRRLSNLDLEDLTVTDTDLEAIFTQYYEEANV